MEMLGKNPKSHEVIRNEVSVYEKQTIEIDDFDETEEKEIKERVEKIKIKIREVAENNKLLKKKRNKKTIKKKLKCLLD